jgi:hypothetical protein
MIEQTELEKLSRALLWAVNPFQKTTSIEQLKKDADAAPAEFLECLSELKSAWDALNVFLNGEQVEP